MPCQDNQQSFIVILSSEYEVMFDINFVKYYLPMLSSRLFLVYLNPGGKCANSCGMLNLRVTEWGLELAAEELDLLGRTAKQ